MVRGETETGRFFLMGDGKIKIKNMHSGREASATLLNPDGSLNEEGFTRIDEVFQFPTREKGEHISPRLIFMLDYFSDRVAPGKAIKMESGYRSPDYNTGLRNAGGNVAPTSLHMDGMALDFSIDGVNGKRSLAAHQKQGLLRCRTLRGSQRPPRCRSSQVLGGGDLEGEDRRKRLQPAPLSDDGLRPVSGGRYGEAVAGGGE